MCFPAPCHMRMRLLWVLVLEMWLKWVIAVAFTINRNIREVWVVYLTWNITFLYQIVLLVWHGFLLIFKMFIILACLNLYTSTVLFPESICVLYMKYIIFRHPVGIVQAFITMGNCMLNQNWLVFFFDRPKQISSDWSWLTHRSYLLFRC